jgi:hypothetical protein
MSKDNHRLYIDSYREGEHYSKYQNQAEINQLAVNQISETMKHQQHDY